MFLYRQNGYVSIVLESYPFFVVAAGDGKNLFARSSFLVNSNTMRGGLKIQALLLSFALLRGFCCFRGLDGWLW